VYHEVTKDVPVNQPPSAKYALGSSSKPDQPTNTKRSRRNQSSTSSNQVRFSWGLPIAIVIAKLSKLEKKLSQTKLSKKSIIFFPQTEKAFHFIL
jgi:hypothetical protein